MQNSLFGCNAKIKKLEKERQEKICHDYRLKEAEKDGHNREYCLNQIKTELYLWDMRVWDKPKNEYTKEEIKEHVKKWFNDT